MKTPARNVTFRFVKDNNILSSNKTLEVFPAKFAPCFVIGHNWTNQGTVLKRAASIRKQLNG
jgi:hypothetical protein